MSKPPRSYLVAHFIEVRTHMSTSYLRPLENPEWHPSDEWLPESRRPFVPNNFTAGDWLQCQLRERGITKAAFFEALIDVGADLSKPNIISMWCGNRSAVPPSQTGNICKALKLNDSEAKWFKRMVIRSILPDCLLETYDADISDAGEHREHILSLMLKNGSTARRLASGSA